MTRTLRLGLWAEGSADIEFLQRILQRTTHAMAFSLAPFPVDVDEIFARIARPPRDLPRSERIVRAFGPHIADGSVALLFVHSDGGNDPTTALRDNVQPGLAALQKMRPDSDHRFGAVPVVPVRETEAWALADIPALRRILGTGKSDAELGLSPGLIGTDVEAITDPKSILRQAGRLAAGRRRRVRPGSRVIPPGLGSEIDLDALRRLASFKRLEADLALGIARALGLPDASSKKS